MNKHRILDIFIILSFCVLGVSLYKSIEVKKRHNLEFYLLPVEKEIIESNEIFEENIKKFYSVFNEEKKEILKNYYKFLKLNNEEKALLLKNYTKFLNFDPNTRENLRKIYKEIFSE
ncbi:MAG: hypothetical protein N2589_03585 [bacterium]|nr:hypothetical protein [bacterium]